MKPKPAPVNTKSAGPAITSQPKPVTHSKPASQSTATKPNAGTRSRNRSGNQQQTTGNQRGTRSTSRGARQEQVVEKPSKKVVSFYTYLCCENCVIIAQRELIASYQKCNFSHYNKICLCLLVSFTGI